MGYKYFGNAGEQAGKPHKKLPNDEQQVQPIQRIERSAPKGPRIHPAQIRVLPSDPGLLSLLRMPVQPGGNLYRNIRFPHPGHLSGAAAKARPAQHVRQK